MLKVFKCLFDSLVDAAEDLNGPDILLFVFVIGCMTAMILGFAALFIFLCIKYPIVGIAFLVSFALPIAAVWHAKHK